MSEYTDYYAVESEPIEDIKSKLEKADVLSAIVDAPLLRHPEDKWVVVEAPAGIDESDPWETLKKTFSKIIHIFVEEGGRDWSLTTSFKGEEKVFNFNEEKGSPEFSDADKQYLADLFSSPFEALSEHLNPNQAHTFCQFIQAPFLEMEDQNQLARVIPEHGKVILISQIMD